MSGHMEGSIHVQAFISASRQLSISLLGSQFSGVSNMKQPLFFQILLPTVFCLYSLTIGQQIPKLHGHFKLLELIQSSLKPHSALFSPSHSKDLHCGSEGLPVRWRTWALISVLAQFWVCLLSSWELGKESGEADIFF